MINIYQKTVPMHAVQFNGTEDNIEEIIDFLRDRRGVLTDEEGNEIGRREAGLTARNGRAFRTGGITVMQTDAQLPLFEDPTVAAVVWNDLHRYWNPLRLTDHVALDSQGCFYPIADADVLSSYMKVGEA